MTMTLTKEQLIKFSKTTSVERIESFAIDNSNNLDVVLARYANNITISQALYPELSTLEITLRNSINFMLKNLFGENWLEEEVKYNKFLTSYDYDTLKKAYSDTKEKYLEKYSIGKVISNINFGFWTNLCSKKYNSIIWTKKGCFKTVFVNYPSDKQQQIHEISKKLDSIRRLRNRIFHYEPILKEPEKILSKYNEILEILSYLEDNKMILDKTSNFLEVYAKIARNLEHYTIKS